MKQLIENNAFFIETFEHSWGLRASSWYLNIEIDCHRKTLSSDLDRVRMADGPVITYLRPRINFVFGLQMKSFDGINPLGKTSTDVERTPYFGPV